MDQALKARHMSSASARRRRIQERQEERILALKRYEEYRNRMLEDDFADYAEDEYTDEDLLDVDTAHLERDLSIETPSEHSISTPKDTPQISFTHADERRPKISTSAVHIVDSDESIEMANSKDLLIAPVPKFQPSLSTFADFDNERYFSTMSMDADEEPLSDVDSIDSFSSMQIAKPISFSLPKTKPIVISVTNSRRRKQRTESLKSYSSIDDSPIRPPPRSSRRLSTSSARSGFLACEATPFEIPDLPANASTVIANASREYLDDAGPKASPKKSKSQKAAVPLLSALKTETTRKNSVKGLLRSPSHNSASSQLEAPRFESSIAIADAGIDSVSFETVPASFRNATPPPRSAQRVQSAALDRSYTYDSYHTYYNNGSFTALPPIMTPPAIEFDQDPMIPVTKLPPQRKQSLTAIRRRNQSTSHSIRSTSTKATSTGPHTPKDSIELARFPIPPLAITSAKKGKRSSVVPHHIAIHGDDGLGLNMI